ncbi:MAG: hypothetical protein WAZ15_01055, partial [Propioniciclava sp.]
ARVDALLDDPVFFAPFVPFFDPRIGRPSTPLETYSRIQFCFRRVVAPGPVMPHVNTSGWIRSLPHL